MTAFIFVACRAHGLIALELKYIDHMRVKVMAESRDFT